VEAEDSEPAGRTDRVRTVGAEEDAGGMVGQAADAPTAVGTSGAGAGAAAEALELDAQQPTAAPDADTDADSDAYAYDAPNPGTDAEADAADVNAAESDSDAALDADQASRKGRPVSSGIGCAALLLPLVAVAGAILCFAAGILSTVTGCTPNGSALCSANGAWFEFALPLFVSPIIAAATAIGAVTVRRHRSSWLAVGYGIVFISIIVGLASASTGSS